MTDTRTQDAERELLKAAGEIERLRAERDAARAEAKKLKAFCGEFANAEQCEECGRDMVWFPCADDGEGAWDCERCQLDEARTALAAKTEEVKRLRAEREGLGGMLNGLYRVFHALAEDDRLGLATVNEMVQADVDAVVAERIELRAERDVLAREVKRLRALVRDAYYEGSNDTGEAYDLGHDGTVDGGWRGSKARALLKESGE